MPPIEPENAPKPGREYVNVTREDTLDEVEKTRVLLYDLAGIDWSAVSHQALPGNYGKSLVPYFGANIRTAYSTQLAIDQPNVTPEEMAKSRSEAEKRLRSLGYIR